MSILDLPQGIYADVPEAEYHARVLGLVNKGALDAIARTPAHYRAWLIEPPQEESPALALGKALHMRVGEPERFAATYIAEAKHPFRRVSEAQRNAKKPSDETLAAIEYWDAWAASSAGKVELSAADAAKVEAMRESILAHPVAGRIFEEGQAESTCVWTDPEHGLACKSRMDYWRADINLIADLKTTEDASPAAFARSVANYRYAVQDAHYSAGLKVCNGEAPSFLFVAIEKCPPYAVAVYQLERDSQRRGAELRHRDMDALNTCLRSDQWPAYPVGVTTLSLPAWAFKDAA